MGATPSTTTAPSELSDDAAPRADAAIEDRFEYVLACAKRAGFDGFDAMALQYYAHNFDGRSPLALEQRLSRNRQLPRLLSELSRRSGSWSAWQRSGFLDETLKAAEQICARECGEYRAAERERETGMGTPESMDEMPLEDRVSSDSNRSLKAFPVY
ncbi:uncharacterized protein C8A04DRAFT_15112 [Dichotomopilus funicola]|uniref:Uncharacterized protein n=1 Tax=Dichotomopilus funicola TaxID=1934379 RepID=A0AAN6ZK26_9PEZI|nr:hypothetical protein C8A04DRAFT_15112 [Dichotomopilus funicola]